MVFSDAVSVFALLVSLGSGAVALRYTRTDTRFAAYDRSTDLFLEVDRLFLAQPDLRPYFYDGVQLAEDDVDRHRVEAAAELVLDVFEWIWRRQEELSHRDQEGWRHYILEMLDASPELCRFHHRHPAWHPWVNEILLSRAKNA
ncbi:hypothetical protein [Micromonospora sp. NPDC005174]|uniref:hypothetical protein n=1 Tax=unclassified Micromonospora TaxID=2617518 RepID=UPI0033A08D63